MTVKEKLLKEYEAAISAVFGDLADKDYRDVQLIKSDLEEVSEKVAFYLDLDY